MEMFIVKFITSSKWVNHQFFSDVNVTDQHDGDTNANNFLLGTHHERNTFFT